MTAQKANYSIILNSIRCDDEAGSWGLGEPYFWTVSFRIGGEEIRQSQKDQFCLEGVPAFTFSQGSHGNIGGPMDVGDVRLIPGTVGSFNSEISPLEFDILGNHIIIPGFIGLITVLMEEESLTDKEAESGHQAINRMIVYRMKKFLRELDLQNIFLEAADLTDPTISITDTFFRIFKSKLEYEIFQLADDDQKEIKNAIYNGQSGIRHPWSWIDTDVFVGSKMSLFTTDDFTGKRNEIELRASFNEGEGAYEVTGKFTLSKQEVPAGISHTQIDGPEVQAMSRA